MLQPWIRTQVVLVCFQGICVSAEANSKADQRGEETAQQGRRRPCLMCSTQLNSNGKRIIRLQHKSYIVWRPPCCASDRGGAIDPAPPPFSQYLQEEICLSETFLWKLRPEVAVS